MNSCSRGKPPEVIRESQLALKVLGMSLKGREKERNLHKLQMERTRQKKTYNFRESEKSEKRSVCTSKFKCQLWTAANSVRPSPPPRPWLPSGQTCSYYYVYVGQFWCPDCD